MGGLMLENKNIIVTGASRGIGKAISLTAARQGARVGINFYHNPQLAEQAAEEIIAEGFLEPEIMAFDATSAAAVREAVEDFLKKYQRIDGWVNNAAINISGLLPVLSTDEISQQIQSALIGPIFCCQAILPHLLSNHQGSIVNIGSVVVQKTCRGQSVYAAAKGGLAAFTRSLAAEYRRKGIRINCVQPGPVDTGMTEKVKTLTWRSQNQSAFSDLIEFIPAEDIATLVVYLLSDQSSSMTGSILTMDRGYSLT
jgi:3-oxoacyl-[acyl-carrier protein] reductase